MKNKKILFRGFSLVELLVAISIMAILASILYVNFANARAASRDDIRKSDLKQLQLAIEYYKAQNGSFPTAGCSTTAGSFTATTCANYIVGLTDGYIVGALPRDPLTKNSYQYSSDGTNYKLINTSVEAKTLIGTGAAFYEQNEFARCASGSGGSTAVCPSNPSATHAVRRTYAVYSAGAAAW